MRPPAMAIREKTLGPDHPDTATSLNNLATLRRAQGDLAGARRSADSPRAAPGATTNWSKSHHCSSAAAGASPKAKEEPFEFRRGIL
jgi:hypothetical protein